MDLSLLDLLPVPAIVVTGRYELVFVNRKAKEVYGDARTCHQLSHRSPVPCREQDGKPCPLHLLTDSEAESAGAVHVHRTSYGNRYFYVLTSRIGEDLYLELHLDLTEMAGSFRVSGIQPELLLSSGPIVFLLRENREGFPIRLVSPNVYTLLGYTVEDLSSGGVKYADLVHPEDLPRIEEEIRTHTEERAPSWTHEDYRLLTREGRVKWVLDHTVPVKNRHGEITHYYSYIMDITEKHEKDELFRHLAENNPSGVLLYDFKNNRVIYANRALSEITEYTVEELISMKDPLSIVHPKDRKTVKRYISRRHRGERGTFSYTVRFVTRWGRIRWVKVTSSVITYRGEEVTFVTLTDITAEKIRERKLRELATLDQLTRVYNRHALVMFLEKQLFSAERYGTPFSVVLFDVDNFKSVNDTYGHLTGDRVLRTLARLIRRNIRKTDIFGRWGGEEFLLILPFSDSPYFVAEKLRRLVEGHRFERAGRITVSAGATAYREGDDLNSIVTRADTALYTAKSKGKNRTVVL